MDFHGYNAYTINIQPIGNGGFPLLLTKCLHSKAKRHPKTNFLRNPDLAHPGFLLLVLTEVESQLQLQGLPYDLRE